MKEKRTAKIKRILYARLMGEKITPLDANRIGHTSDGTRMIRRIRERYPVKNEQVKGRSYHVYWIDENFIEDLKRERNEINEGSFFDTILSMANF